MTKLTHREQAVTLDCRGETLVGIHHPAGSTPARRGVLIVVGGPQYRVGSHRQFVLLARDLAAAGVPVLRFDYRGMGDSSGSLKDFSDVDQDIRTALDRFQEISPGLQEFVIWGLCDAASAAAFYGWQDHRVKGLVMLNPWVRTEQMASKVLVKHYYLQRLVSGEFWSKLFSGKLNIVGALSEFLRHLSLGRAAKASAADGEVPPDSLDLPGRMLFGLERFSGQVLLILSGRDNVAKEFLEHFDHHPAWIEWADNAALTRRDLAEADHTFSSQKWRDEVSGLTIDWLERLR